MDRVNIEEKEIVVTIINERFSKFTNKRKKYRNKLNIFISTYFVKFILKIQGSIKKLQNFLECRPGGFKTKGLNNREEFI